MLPSVTVIIPTYNRIKALQRAIDSVLNQTYKSWELLIIDDGSTDNTKEVFETKYAQEPRIKYLERPVTRSKGANVCRNIGIEEAKGKYIALLDSDDEWIPTHLQDCVNLALSSVKFHGCYSGAIVRRGKYNFQRKSREINPNETHFDFLLNGGFSPTPTLFVKTDSALKVKFDEDLQRHQDWDFFIRFGERYGWIFNGNIDVIINWDIDTSSKDIDFSSCISFYQKYSDKLNPENKKQYIWSMYKKSLVRNNAEASKFYKKELRKIGVDNGFAIKFPSLFRTLELGKSKFQIYKLKKVMKFYLNKMLSF